MKFNFHRASLIFSLAAATFVYGIAVGRYQLFPYPVIRDAKLALNAWRDVLFAEESAGQILEPAVHSYSETAGDEWILVSAGDGYVREETPQSGCVAWVIDRMGTVRHEWRQPPELWQDLTQVETVPGKSFAYPVGIELSADGTLLVNYQGRNCFPHGVGLAKLDRNSQVIWAKELLSHHWLTVGADGRIAVPGLKIVDSPVAFADSQVRIVSDKTKVLEDTILILDSEGNLLEEISMLDALAESGYVGLFQGATDLEVNANSWDPIHLNDVRFVDSQIAAENRLLAEGDLLVSFRSLNSIGILDAESHRFKWIAAGTTLRQHSPRFYDRGVPVLDNLGGPEHSGGSRLVRVALETGRPESVFPRAGVELPARFETRTAGHIDIHPDGGRALLAVTHQNRVWEIDLVSGEVLWEYWYVHPIYTAKYCREIDFPLNQDRAVPDTTVSRLRPRTQTDRP